MSRLLIQSDRVGGDKSQGQVDPKRKKLADVFVPCQVSTVSVILLPRKSE